MSKKSNHSEDNYGLAADGTRLPKHRIPYYNHLQELKAKAKAEAGTGTESKTKPEPTKKSLLASLKKDELLVLAAKLLQPSEYEGLKVKELKELLETKVEVQIVKTEESEGEVTYTVDVIETKDSEDKSDAEGSTPTEEELKAKEDADALVEANTELYETKLKEFAEVDSLDPADEMTVRTFAQSLEVDSFDTLELDVLKEAIIEKLKK